MVGLLSWQVHSEGSEGPSVQLGGCIGQERLSHAVVTKGLKSVMVYKHNVYILFILNVHHESTAGSVPFLRPLERRLMMVTIWNLLVAGTEGKERSGGS